MSGQNELENLKQQLQLEKEKNALLNSKLALAENILDGSSNGIALLDLQGNILYINQAWVQLWKFEDPQTLPGLHFSSSSLWIHPEIVLNALQLLPKTSVWAGQLSAKRENDTITQLHTTLSFIRDKKGTPLQIMACVVEDTRQNSQEFIITKANFFAILDAPPLGVTIVKEGETIPFFINSTLFTILGYAKEEIAYNDPIKLFPDQLFASISDNLKIAHPQKKYFLDNIEFTTRNDKNIFFNVISDWIVVDHQRWMFSFYRDVTEKKITEELLIKSENSLQHAQKVAKMGNWEWTLEDDKRIYSKELLNIYGFNHTEDFTHEAFISLLHPDDRERVVHVITKALDEHVPYNFYYKLLMPSGEVKHVHGIAEVFMDEDNKPVKMVGTVQDITEAYLVNETLRKSEKRLKEAQRLARIANWEWDVKENIGFWLNENYSFFGIDNHNVVHTFEEFLEAIHPEDKSHVKIAVNESVAKKTQFDKEYRLVLATGEILYVHSKAELVIDSEGNVSKMLGTIQDITEKMLQQEALRRSEQTLKEAQRIAKIGNWEWDIKTGRRYYSDELLRIYDLPIEEISSYEIFINMYHAEDRERIIQITYEAVERQTPFDTEYRIVLPSGQLKYVHATAKTYFDEEGKPEKMLGTVQDITEQVLARQSLEKSEKRLNRAQQIGKTGYWEWNIVADEVYWSDELYVMYDLTKGEFIPTNNKVIELIYEPERERLTEYIYSSLHNKQTCFQVEGHVLTKKGQLKYFLAKAEIIYDKAGNPLRMEGVSQDITLIKKAEEDLRFKDYLLQHVNDAIVSTDAQLRVTSWNKAAEKIYGYSEGETLGKSLQQLLRFNPPALDSKAHQEFINRGYYKGKLTMKSKEDSEVINEAHTIALKDEKGEFIGRVSVDRDITLFSHMQNKVDESEHMLQLVLDTIPQAIFWKDLHFVYRGCNQNFVRMVGISDASEVIGKTDEEMFWGVDRAKVITQQDEQIMEDKIPGLFYTKLFQTKSGNFIWLDIKRVPLYNKERHIIGILGSLEDITEKKHIEEALTRNRANLEAIIENTDSLIFSISRENRIIAMNSKVGQFYQLSFNKKILVGDDFLEALPDWLSERWISNHQKVLLGEKVNLTRHYKINSQHYWFDIYCFPITEIDGQISGVAYMARDVTERKKNENLLIKYMKQHNQLKLKQEQLKSLAIIQGQEEERRLIAMELHDGVGQILTALNFQMDTLAEKISHFGDMESNHLTNEILLLQRSVYHEIRRISENLMPQFLQDFGLADALEQLTISNFKNTPIQVKAELLTGKKRFEKNLEVALFRIAQEIFNNILKHSQASIVWVNLEEKKGMLSLVVKDNGIGFKLNQFSYKKGKGLNNIKHRTNLLNGFFSIKTNPGNGSEVSIKVPIASL